MGRRSGDRCGRRRARWAGAVAIAVSLAGGLAGCGEGGDDDTAPPDGAETTTTAAGPAPTEQTPSDPSITVPSSPSSSLPEATVAVPLDPELVDALPRLTAGDREIVTGEGFDERLCTGDKAPAVPKSQARATYEVSPTERITVAAYRFTAEGGPLYLAAYAESVRACAVQVGPTEGLGLADAIGQSFRLTTTSGDAFIAMALRGDVIWVLFQESTDGPADVTSATLDSYLRLLSS